MAVGMLRHDQHQRQHRNQELMVACTGLASASPCGPRECSPLLSTSSLFALFRAWQRKTLHHLSKVPVSSKRINRLVHNLPTVKQARSQQGIAKRGAPAPAALAFPAPGCFVVNVDADLDQPVLDNDLHGAGSSCPREMPLILVRDGFVLVHVSQPPDVAAVPWRVQLVIACGVLPAVDSDAMEIKTIVIPHDATCSPCSAHPGRVMNHETRWDWFSWTVCRQTTWAAAFRGATSQCQACPD
ncbi:hypothetical protein S7711_10329 [Stachybotrys chartarum IBT 7711]|uniref:Uncharacterized protein n=1 Tax=Stachybotrys chartarum (strain CBS 109288 / IBT 7711) TaxID=1280523 RepID=A0A084B351_STACB|nr:hypothetical protein S7711_10329 [Stachybotrys chartarum IBT 7711]